MRPHLPSHRLRLPSAQRYLHHLAHVPARQYQKVQLAGHGMVAVTAASNASPAAMFRSLLVEHFAKIGAPLC